MDLMDQICSFSSLVLAVNKTIVVCTALNTFLSLFLSLSHAEQKPDLASKPLTALSPRLYVFGLVHAKRQ